MKDQETVDIYAGADAGPADDADARAGVNLEILRRGGGACRRQQSANPATLQMAILRSWQHIISQTSFPVKFPKSCAKS